jgi:hypothetical protein
MKESRALVWRYYLYRITNSAGFYVPIVIIYLQDADFGLDFIGLAYAVFGIGTLAAEIPTGYVGDWLGRRASLAVGTVMRVGVLVAYPLVETGALILLLHVVWATGRSFRSGTQNAWLYELLQAHLDTDEFARIEGRGSTLLLATSAGGAIAGALLYGMHVTYPFYANAALAAAGIPLLFTFPQVGPATGDGAADGANQAEGAPPEPGDRPAEPANETFTVDDAVHVLREQIRRPAVRWLVLYAALVNAIFLVTRTYEQPALDAVGIPVAGFGVLYAGFKLVSAGAAATAGWWQDALGARGVFALLAPVYGLAYVAIAITPLALVPVLFLNRSIRIVARPIRNQYLNDRLENVGRATVLSGVAMVFALVGSTARFVAAPLAEAVGAVDVLAIAGVAGAVLAGVVWLAVDPVRARTSEDECVAAADAPTPAD